MSSSAQMSETISLGSCSRRVFEFAYAAWWGTPMLAPATPVPARTFELASSRRASHSVYMQTSPSIGPSCCLVGDVFGDAKGEEIRERSSRSLIARQ